MKVDQKIYEWGKLKNLKIEKIIKFIFCTSLGEKGRAFSAVYIYVNSSWIYNFLEGHKVTFFCSDLG